MTERIKTENQKKERNYLDNSIIRFDKNIGKICWNIHLYRHLSILIFSYKYIYVFINWVL